MTKKEIKEMYKAWRAQHENHRPDRAVVCMYWEDEGAEETRTDTIAMRTYDIDVKDDEGILFYAGGLKGLLDLMRPGNGSDFVVTEVIQFYREK